MTTREFYESIGASYDSVLVRFGSEKMITKFAKRFADDTTFQDMCEGIEPLHAVACEELVFLTAQLIVSRILQIQLPQQSAQCL